MSPEYWQKIKLILDEALAKTPTTRGEFLAAACGANHTLRRDVESLLAFEKTDGDALEAAAFAPVGDSSIREKNFVGKTFGNYKILEKLGEGGMGAVFLAERDDGEFRQRVAVKVIRGGIASDVILRRFLNERQILAELEHPNIARLIDGGTAPDGTPFLVMEYVEGLPIDDYADQKDLSLTERLDLFRRVCAAVAHAHKNLVIHRDLKPSNILVSEDGAPKLLDFGIAKLLKADGGETQTRQFAFTPEYASPEQVKGEKLTTATDVYSLGVILYELLTGVKPYQLDNRNVGEAIRVVCETQPERPSSVVGRPSPFISNAPSAGGKLTDENNGRLTNAPRNEPKTNPKSKIQNPKSLKGDLDNIVLKALRKEPERRYSSVEQFSEDVRRHLAGLPVAARSDAWTYRAGKFVRRNRAAAAFAALVFLALIGGIAATAWQARRAERQRAIAEERLNNLRRMSSSLVEEVHVAIRDLPGSLPARELLTMRAAQQLDALSADAEDNPVLYADLAMAYQHLSSLPHKTMADRRDVLLKADRLYEKVLALDPHNNVARGRSAMVLMPLADFARAQNDLPAALEYNRRAVSIVETALANEPDNALHKVFWWNANYNLALTLYQMGDAKESAAAVRRILPVAEELRRLGQVGTEKYNFMRPHLTRSFLAEHLTFTGDYAAAAEEARAAIADCEREMAARPNEMVLVRNLATIQRRLAYVSQKLNDPRAALKNTDSSLENFEKLLAADPKNLDYQGFQAGAHFAAGQLLVEQNQPEKALPHFRRALELNEAIFAADAQRTQARADAAQANAHLGSASAATGAGEPEEGLRRLREAVAFYESAGAGATADAHLKRNFAEARALLAAALMKNPNPARRAEARQFYAQSLELWRDLQQRGALRHADAAQPAEIARRLANFDETRSG